jgi:hypothetical protein
MSTVEWITRLLGIHVQFYVALAVILRLLPVEDVDKLPVELLFEPTYQVGEVIVVAYYATLRFRVDCAIDQKSDRECSCPADPSSDVR